MIDDNADVPTVPTLDDITSVLFTHSTSEDKRDDDDADAVAAAVASKPVDSTEAAEDIDLTTDADDIDDTDDTDDKDDDQDGIQPEGDDEDEELAAQDSDDQQYLDIQDDDTFEVKVDGEVVTRTIGDAKAALSGEGAIQKRLKAATLEKQATAQDRLNGLQDLEQKRTEFNNYVQSLDTLLFKPHVALPDESLRSEDVAAYLDQTDRYNADQQRISTGRVQLAHDIQEQRKQQASNLKQLQMEQGVILTEKLPGLLDNEKSPAIHRDIASSIEYYGFTPEEASVVADHRLFLMAYEAAQYRKLKSKSASKKDILDVTTNVRPARKLRSGSNTSRKRMVATRTAKVNKRVMDRARETGKADDILATILKPAG